MYERRLAFNRTAPYAFALVSVGVCALARWMLNPLLENQGLYLAFMIPVAASAYVGGTGPAAISALTSAAIANPILASRAVELSGAITHLVLFGVESAAVILLIGRLQQSNRDGRRALADAEAAQSRAEEAGRAKEQFVARVSHEWRAPLNVMSGWLWQLERGARSDEFMRQACEGMRRAIDTQTRLVSDLLDYSRGTRSKLSLRPARHAIVDPLTRAIDAIAADASSKQITIEVVAPFDRRDVWGDEVRLEQVFTNLLHNATKFTPPGGTIRVTFDQSDEEVEVTIADSGVGIPADALARIFDPFGQADPVAGARGGGLGLGLAIARDIVELHRGTLTAASAGPGTGSAFSVRLPAAGPSSARPPGVNDEADDMDTRETGRHRRRSHSG
jgi:signal transduction histidine kinase